MNDKIGTAVDELPGKCIDYSSRRFILLAQFDCPAVIPWGISRPYPAMITDQMSHDLLAGKAFMTNWFPVPLEY